MTERTTKTAGHQDAYVFSVIQAWLLHAVRSYIEADIRLDSSSSRQSQSAFHCALEDRGRAAANKGAHTATLELITRGWKTCPISPETYARHAKDLTAIRAKANIPTPA